MSTTSADVALHAGVSRATVSQVLNGHSNRFTPETAARVLRAAEELGYQPSTAGRMLRSGLSDFVIALVPNTTFGSNLQDIFGTVTDMLSLQGLTLVLRLSTDSPSSLDAVLGGMRPRAVLSLQPFTDVERQVLADRGVPGFDGSVEGAVNLNFVVGRLQAEHLIERGFRQLAFAHLRDARQDPFGDDREAGVIAASTDAGLQPPAVIGFGVDLDSAGDALSSLQAGVGVACYNDDLAITLLNAATARHWRVPNDLGIIGMDNTPLAHVTAPRLTTVSYDLAAVARATTTAALSALGQELPPENADINLRVIPGGST
ncbi:LacI family DNA-binding transcriptional regulator [Microbacterium sp. 2MCAF23]|uniref:LacI family DNA-binding transcriptional regulator n=1 Tax=Microbacterium sp. 2MCAF23 TaxID=3232985 RepID=UPI003F9CD0F1